MNKIISMLAVMGIIGFRATIGLAVDAVEEPKAVKAEAVPVKDKAAGKKVSGEKKNGKAVEKIEKKVTISLTKEQQEGFKKQFPKLSALRQQVDDATTDLRNLKEISGEKERRKAERLIPKAEEKLASLLQKLDKEYVKTASPYDAEWEKLKDLDGNLTEKIAELEAKKKKADKLWLEREQISGRLQQLDSIRSGLAMMATVEPDK